MDFTRTTVVMLVLLETALANIDIRRGGWLDRVVDYHKAKFIKDVKRYVPLNLKATIIPTPQGYEDSKNWDYTSVLHLMVLIKGSEAAAPVHRALRRMLQPSRRLMMSMADSFKHFPSLSKLSLNEFYYDVGSAEDYGDEEVHPVEDGVIVVSNPVEARLPSSQISIKLLKDILIQRAIAGRALPSTARFAIPWVPMNTTESNDTETTGDGSESTNGPETGDGGGNSTAADGAAPAEGSTVAASGDSTGPAAAGDATTPVGDAPTTAAADDPPAE